MYKRRRFPLTGVLKYFSKKTGNRVQPDLDSLQIESFSHKNAQSAWEALCAGDPAAKRGRKKHYGFSRNTPTLPSPDNPALNYEEASVRRRSGHDKA